jgi:hypothetical protein
VNLRAHRKRPRSSRSAEKRDALAAFQLIEVHRVTASQVAKLQDIELARISQEVTATSKAPQGGRFIVGLPTK